MDSFSADVNSWLVTFGFQLYNVIPGYRKPNTDSMEPSYELVRTQIKTQEWDSTKVNQSVLTSSTLYLATDHLCSPLLSDTINRETCSLSPESQRSCQLSVQNTAE